MDIIKRVLAIWLLLFIGTIIGLEKLHADANPEIPEEFKRVLEDHMSIPTKVNENALRKLAYEVEVTEDELNWIREHFEETNMYRYMSYDNLRLAHFYSVILNRYSPSIEYRDTTVLIEYVYDGLLNRRHLGNITSRDMNDSSWNEEVFLMLLINIGEMESHKKENALQRIMEDFTRYASTDVKVNVNLWVREGLPFQLEENHLNMWERFKTLLFLKLNQDESNIL